MQLTHEVNSELFFFSFLEILKMLKKKRKLQRIAAFGRVKFFTNIQLICLRRYFTFIDRANSQQQLPQGTLCCQDPTISKRLATVGKKSSLLGQTSHSRLREDQYLIMYND